jgi:hypothetical protein
MFMPKTLPVLILSLLLLAYVTGCTPEPSSGHISISQPSSTPTPSPTPTPPETTSTEPSHKKHARKGGRNPASVGSESPTSADPDTLLEQAADNLPTGQVAVNHPEQMKVSHADTVRVRISRDQAVDLSKGLPAEGHATEHDPIAISTSMKVQLFGEPDFDIKPLDDTEQLITNKGFTEWSFTVVPLRSGKLPLHVRITAIVRAAGIEKTKDFPVKDEFIQVRVSPMAAVGTFVSKNWQWLWSTILVPIALWLWNRQRKNKDKKDDSGKQP